MTSTPLAAFVGPLPSERPAAPRPGTTSNLPSLLEAYEKSLILAALAATNGHQRRAARILGVGATTLHAKLKRLRLEHTPHLHAMAGAAPGGTEELRWRGRLDGRRALEIRLISGDITIEPSADDDSVEVLALKHARPLGSAPRHVEIDVAQVETGLRIAVRYPDSDHGGAPADESQRVDLRLRVPRDARIDASTVHGAIDTSGLTGVLKLESGRGHVRVGGRTA